MTALVAVEELRRAYAAARAGAFRDRDCHAASATTPPPVGSWTAAEGERVVLVAPCSQGAGASTVALAIATAAGAARVVECCTASASALAGAADAELGRASDGWVEGARGEVLLQRRGDRVAGPADLPSPPPGSVSVTVLDCGWAAEDLLGSRGWLGDLARTLSTVVLVARPTLPGLRRAEITLALVGAERAHLVLVGMHPRRWPRTVDRAAGPLTRRLRAAGRITCLPFHAGLAVTGVTSEPLPVGVLRAARSLFVVLEGALP